ncbi:hypothetical protein [Lysinibacillus sp. NPDC086135]|uniref:hypothetical protein n=1 Tax=Lysinibacillus sp. NPDC086135 TaxID=3364130 RepID=UPI00380D5778
MTIKIIVNFTNNDFLTTSINCTLKEAKECYIGQSFTDSNENTRQGVNVYLYDEWKESVLQYCMDNNNTVLNFDDYRQLMTFKTHQNEMITVTYDEVNNSMSAIKGWTFGDLMGNGWGNPLYDTKEKAINMAKQFFKSSEGRFIEVGYLININNQLNVVKTENIIF